MQSKSSQILFDKFQQSFGSTLNPENKWIILSELIPWGKIENEYARNFYNENSKQIHSFRSLLGTLIIKTRLDLSDDETIEQIKQNPYLQFFIGYTRFSTDVHMNVSTLVHFRKLLDIENISGFS